MALACLVFGAGPALTADGAGAGSVGWALAPADGDFGANRANYTYAVAAGTTFADGIVIESRSDAALRLKVYAADGYTTPDGLMDLRAAAEAPEDAGAWVKFGAQVAGRVAAPEAGASLGGVTDSGDGGAGAGQAGGGETAADAAESAGQPSIEVSLEPGGAVTVPFTVAVPADARPGDHAAGIVTSVLDSPGSASVQVDRRLALRAHINVAGELASDLTISALRVKAHPSANPFASGDLTVSYILTNTGNVRLVPTEEISAVGPGGSGRSEGDPQTLPEVLPGSHLSREVTVRGVFPLFRTTVDVEVGGLAVGLGGEGQAASDRAHLTIWTVPWVWLGLVLILAGAGFGVPWWRGRRSVGAGEAPAGHSQ
ncbi:MAG: hypothetical protein LBO20_04365 [Bifidobacteriaceae bacterium]|nr:hypothetical protein [Bifidobacteriaceae bacterium]